MAPIHPKAMPVILGNDEADAWLHMPTADALKTFQRPLADDGLVLVGTPDSDGAYHDTRG